VRPAWQQQRNDHWILLENIAQLSPLLRDESTKNTCFFFTIGQLATDYVMKKHRKQIYIVRSALDASFKEPDHVTWINSKGPFSVDEERQLFKQYQVDVLISKNSGGQSVDAKIQIAREMKLPVYMLQRPDFESTYPIFHSINLLLSALKSS
jgi:precorrin-6A/cobalt-precorrin-6A reductase